MLRRNPPAPTDDAPDETMPSTPPDGPAVAPGEPDLVALPVIGLTRRRLATILGVALSVWILLVFARQVSDASAASGRADAMIAANAVRRDQVAGLERELAQIQQPPYVLQQARGYGLGGTNEIPFTLEAGAPKLAANAPGSAAKRVGAGPSMTPLERWLTVLFGPADRP